MTPVLHPDFNLDTYRKMLMAALENGYRFLPFDCLHQDNIPDAPLCLLRHDIDADMQAAVKMAEVEHSLGIKSTYFFMLRSPIYNFTSRANNEFAKKIKEMGHFIGLHFDQAYHANSHKSEVEWMTFEAKIIEDLLDTSIITISFHQPSPAVVEGSIDTGKFMNTYSDPREKGFHYMSDSNRQWMKETAFEAFKNKSYPRLQLLIHPFWWVYGHCLTTEEAWDYAISINIGHMQRQLVDTERAYGQARNILIQAKKGQKDNE